MPPPVDLPQRDELPASRWDFWRAPFYWGVATSLFQLMLCLAIPRARGLGARHLAIFQWDGFWYLSIAGHGYHTTIPPTPQNPELSNVAFFPGYPLLAMLVSRATGIRTERALLLVAQLAAIGFWVLFYGLVKRSQPSRAAMAAAGFFVVSFPSAFYLQAPYSESLFLLCLLAFLAFQAEPQPRPLAAAVAGFMMSATRIVGAPLGLIGLAQTLAFHIPRWPPRRVLLRQCLIAAASLAGAGAFFLYCHLRWGVWNVYMWTQEIGWAVSPDYRALFRAETWSHFGLPRNLDPFLAFPGLANTTGTSLSLWGMVATGLLELVFWRRFGVRGFRERLPYYLAASMMAFISVSGLAAKGFESMIRYVFPIHVMLVLGHVHLWARVPERLFRVRRIVTVAALLLGAYLLLMEFHFLRQFIRASWVA